MFEGEGRQPYGTSGLRHQALSYDMAGEVEPDLDLHVFCDDGRHVGMNYDTGEYEVEIDDAITNGDNQGAPEWIFFPPEGNEGCHHVVSAHDNAAFLEANPGWEPDMLTITCKDGRIQEARLCLSRDLRPVPCGRDVVRDCQMTDALFDPIR